jgi:ABC-2 type transport system permease protein
MHADVLRRDLTDRWRGIAVWSVGAALIALVYILFYPTIHQSGAGIQAMLDTMPKAFRDAFLGSGVDFLSPTGYLGTELFSILAPALMLVMGILAGSRALAREEENGTIDLLLATPIRRRRVAAEKAVGAQVPLFLVAAFLWAVVALVGPSQGLSVNLGTLAVALLAVALLAVSFSMVAFLVASATGSSALGGGVAGGLAVLAYVLNVFGSLVSSLTGFANTVSPFHWVGGAGVLATGVDWPGMVALLVCPVVLLGVAILLYERRDLAA